MVRILPLSHKDITYALADDLKNKFSSIGLFYDPIAKAKSHTVQFAKLALKDLDYIEIKLDKFELKNKLPNIRIVLESLSQSVQPSERIFKLAAEDLKHIIKILDSIIPPPDFSPYK